MDRIFGSPALHRRVDDDRGIALVVAVALMALVTTLLVVMVSVAIHENSSSGRDRQRSSAVMTAEGQVDNLIADIQSAAIVDLPCGSMPALNPTVGSDTMTIASTVTYFTAAQAAVDCGSLATTTLATAKIKATSTSNALPGQPAAVRRVETLLHLTPTHGNAFDKAIFGYGGVSLANNGEIFGEGGLPNADVYTHGSMTCNNHQTYHGSIFAQGTVTMSNTCVVDVDVYAQLGYTADNPGVSVNGKVLVSAGSIILGNSSLGQQARASGTVTGNVCSPAGNGKCIAGDANVAPPPSVPFPQYLWDTETQDAYLAKGYALETFPKAGYLCEMYGHVDGVGKWLNEHSGSTTKTIIFANCPTQPVKFQGVDLNLGADLVIFATGGVNFSGNTTIRSTTAASHLLYLIQPYNFVTQPCTVDGISLDNQVTVEATIDDLLYTPCNIRKANNSTHYGQIYAGGNVQIDNRLTMYFKPLPIIGHVIAAGTIEKYSADILYKRETNS